MYKGLIYTLGILAVYILSKGDQNLLENLVRVKPIHVFGARSIKTEETEISSDSKSGTS